MSEIDDKIKKTLASIDRPIAESQAIRIKEIQAMIATVTLESAKKLRYLKWSTMIQHALAVPALLFGAYLILESSRPNDIAAGLFISTSALAWLIVVKLWFWVVHSRIRMETQLKELELGILEIKESLK